MRICFKTVSASCQCKSQKYLNYFFSGSEQQAGQGRNQWQFYSAIGCNDHLRKLQRTNAMGHDLHSILRTFSVKRVHVEISSLQVLIHICSRHNCFRSSTMCPYLKRKLCTNRTKQNKKKRRTLTVTDLVLHALTLSRTQLVLTIVWPMVVGLKHQRVPAWHEVVLLLHEAWSCRAFEMPQPGSSICKILRRRHTVTLAMSAAGTMCDTRL